MKLVNKQKKVTEVKPKIREIYNTLIKEVLLSKITIKKITMLKI